MANIRASFDRALTTLGLLPPPGFSSIAIPVPHGSLYLNPIITAETPSVPFPDTTPSPGSQSRRLPSPPNKPEFNGAYTLLIVNDNPVDRKILSKICERWGQPYELAENGQEAVNMYKQDPEKFRCILMDVVMPVMDGFEATKQIREFEEESWRAFLSSQSPFFTGASSAPTRSASKPPRRTVIIAMVPSYAVAGLRQRIIDTGFDLSFSRPLPLGTLRNMLFSGPGMNVVGLSGGVDDHQLKEAGYPLQIRRRKPSSIGEREMGEVLGQAVI